MTLWHHRCQLLLLFLQAFFWCQVQYSYGFLARFYSCNRQPSLLFTATGTDAINADVERTRLSLVHIMDHSWGNVTQMLPSSALEICESSLKANTALLVLAAIRYSANRYSTSRDTFEGMLSEADRNHDGQLSFIEWYDWLRQSSDVEGSSIGVGDSVTEQGPQSYEDDNDKNVGTNPAKKYIDVNTTITEDASEGYANVEIMNETDSPSSHEREVSSTADMDSEASVESEDDPIVIAIDHVLSSAVRTLRVIARITDNPELLTASFVAGGLLAGNVDDSISSQILIRLPEAVKELVLVSIALESSSISVTAVSTAARLDVKNDVINSIKPSKYQRYASSARRHRRRRRSKALLNFSPLPLTSVSSIVPSEVIDPEHDDSQPQQLQHQPGSSDTIDAEKKEEAMDESIIMTVDLSSIPVVEAPPINEEDDRTHGNIEQRLLTQDDTNVVVLLENMERDAELQLNQVDAFVDEEVISVETNLVEQQYHLRKATSKEYHTSIGQSYDQEKEEEEISRDEAAGLSSFDSIHNQQQQGTAGGLYKLKLLSSQIADLMNGIESQRAELEDLDDTSASIIRTMIATKTESRIPTLSLVFALRIARLQDAKRRLSKAKRQLVAVETLQFLAPLSYQVKLHSFTQELEVYSYVHLYPTAFGSFINWYNAFQPTAQRLITLFRSQLEAMLENDSLISQSFFKICIQSRRKAPGSAFKKLIQKGQVVRDLHDLLGVRVIAYERIHKDSDTIREKNSSVDSNPIDDENYNIFFSNNKSVVNYNHTINNGLYRIVESIKGLPGWKSIPSRFKDYIDTPKKSGYQSIHLCVRHLSTGLIIEVQVRSDKMHWEAEYGRASHSNYKALLLPSPKSESIT